MDSSLSRLDRLKVWYRKDRLIIITALIIGFIVTGFTGYNTKQYSDTIHTGLEQNLIRFHVIANSDSSDDQNLKLKVRDAILERIQPLLEGSQSIEQSRQVLLKNEQNIKHIAEEIIKDDGKSYNVTVALDKIAFPTKQYGDVVLPAGEYEALRVVIGDGVGKNWWCVMFPPLCFVDITHGTVPDETKKELQKVLTEDEYNIIVSAKTDDVIPVKVKFKIVELWQQNKEIKTIFAKLNGIGE